MAIYYLCQQFERSLFMTIYTIVQIGIPLKVKNIKQ